MRSLHSLHIPERFISFILVTAQPKGDNVCAQVYGIQESECLASKKPAIHTSPKGDRRSRQADMSGRYDEAQQEVLPEGSTVLESTFD